MVTEAKTVNYWISNSALYIQLNATGEPNRIQASVVSGASILCYMQGIDGLGYDAGHNYQRWTLAAYPSEFPSDERRYLYVAIPRPKKTDSPDGTIRQRNLDDVALVVFPSERIDIYGKSITDESKQVGSEDYYYIYLQGIISEVQITKDNVRYRAWVNPQPFDYGSLATDEALDSGGVRQWWQYNSIDDTISFLKTIANATFSFLKITQGLLFGDKDKITGIAKDNTSDTSDELIVTPSFLGEFGVRHFLSKTVEGDTAHGLITFEKGIRFGVQKVADALNEVWDITEAGIAHLSQLFVKGNVQIGEKKKPVEVNFGEYLAGSTGAQVAVKADGTSLAEFDYITIRRAADFRSITIHELRYIGGELAITPAAMQVSKVERLGTDGNVVADDVEPDKFKCYFDTSDSKGEKKVYNEFVVGDQARCQQFGIDAGTHEFVKTKYYWRLVIEVGENYIVLSNTDKDKLTTSEPSVNDNIVQLGYRYEGQDNRQAAIILSATANDAPSQKFYQGINDYSLDHVVKDEGYDAVTGLFHCNIYGDSYTGDKEGKSFFQYDSKKKEATFKGKMIFNSESQLPDGSSVNNIAKKDDLQNLNIKSGNLLRNTSFCGDYESIDISEDTEISEDKETFSEKLKYWTMENASVIDTKDSTSGKAVRIGGTLSQQLAQPLLVDKAYVLSFKGKGTTVKVSVGGEAHDVDMTSSFERYELHITCSDTADDVFSMISTNCTVCEIMLSYGTIAPAWSPSYSDNDKSMAEFQNMKFLTDAITQGSTTIDGGLVMSQQFKVGNFRDKKMIKETGGMSGYYNDDDSPYLWGGGALEQAIYTIQKYKDDPNYQPTEEEISNMAKFVVTHGGRAILNDIILRGIIYAEGGVMKSIKSPNGNFEIDEKGNAKLNGEINSTSGSIGGFEIGFNRIGFKQNFDDNGNLPNSSANQMSLYLSELIFNSKDRQAIIGCCTHYDDFLLRLIDTKRDMMPRYGGIVGVQGSADENVAMEYIGGWLSGVNFKNIICGFHHYAYSSSQPTMPTYKDYEINRTVNCIYATTKCYWKAKDAKEESDANQWVNIKLPELKWYDDGHEILIKRGLCSDNKVNIQARRFCNLEVNYSDYGKPSYEEVWYDTILLIGRGTYVTEVELGSEMDSVCLRFFKDLSVTITNGDGTKKNYRGVWVEFKHPRDW